MEVAWKPTWNWKAIPVQLCLALAIGKMISVECHTNWVASSLWFLALVWAIHAFRSYREYGLKYFDGTTGTFQPKFPNSSRLQILAFFLAIAFVLAVLGLLVQGYSLLWVS